jgi:hypothetical protein
MAEKDKKFEVSEDFRNTGLSDFDGIFPAGVEEGTESEEQFKEKLFEFNRRGKKYYDTIKSKLKAHAPEMPLALMYSLFNTESSFNPAVVSTAGNNPTASLKKLGYTSENMGDPGAKGLGQFMNVTSGYQIAKKFGGKAPNKLFGNYLHDPFDTDKNIEASVKFLRSLIKKFGVSGGLHAYNIGGGRHSVNKFQDKPVSDWSKNGNPNYSEKILNHFQTLQGVSEAPKKSSDIIINIGDSNGIRKAKFSKGLNRGAVGASMKNWLDALTMYYEGDFGVVNTGNENIDIPFEDKDGNAIPAINYRGQPTEINISVIGGNDISKIGKRAVSDTYIKDVAIPLMKLIANSGGSFGGPSPVSSKVKLSSGQSQMELREELNEKLKQAAKTVGITYIDNIEELLSKYDGENPDSLYAPDGIHVKTDKFKDGSSDREEDEELEQPEEREKTRSKYQLSRNIYISGPDIRHASKEDGIKKDNIKYLAAAIKNDVDFKNLLVKIFFKPRESTNVNVRVPERFQGSEFAGSHQVSVSQNERINIYLRLRNYALSRTESNLDALLRTDSGMDYKSYSFLSAITDAWVNGRLASDFQKYKKKAGFLVGSPLEENKGNNQMKITKERLAQIIKEEVEAYKASQLSEVDADEVDEEEAYIKEIADLLKGTYDTFFQSAAPAVGTPQTKADTGERVTDQTAHEDAKGILLDLLGNAIDEFQEKGSMHEDGHDDVPSAVRAMKTMAEDALEMLDALEQMDGNLPTWWTNKMAVSASMLNKMRDYLLVPSLEEVDQYVPCPQTDSDAKTRCEQERQINRQKQKGKNKNESIDEQ